jgi:hypothetical protein
MGTILTGNYKIAPDDIHINNERAVALAGSGFGHTQTEVAAARIVRYCQYRNEEWKPFLFLDVHDWDCASGRSCFYRGCDWHIFKLGRLIERGYIIPQANDTFAITIEFVDICKYAADRNN